MRATGARTPSERAQLVAATTDRAVVEAGLLDHRAEVRQSALTNPLADEVLAERAASGRRTLAVLPGGETRWIERPTVEVGVPAVPVHADVDLRAVLGPVLTRDEHVVTEDAYLAALPARGGKSIPNRYPGTCTRCGESVPAETGRAIAAGHQKWAVAHEAGTCDVRYERRAPHWTLERASDLPDGRGRITVEHGDGVVTIAPRSGGQPVAVPAHDVRAVEAVAQHAAHLGVAPSGDERIAIEIASDGDDAPMVSWGRGSGATAQIRGATSLAIPAGWTFQEAWRSGLLRDAVTDPSYMPVGEPTFRAYDDGDGYRVTEVWWHVGVSDPLS